MKVNFLGKIPDNYSSYCNELEEFDEYDMKELESYGFDEVWYWYTTAPYEGTGQILIRKGELYDLHDAGHCSCFTAVENIKFNGKSLEDLVKSITKEYMVQCKELFEMAGYKF